MSGAAPALSQNSSGGAPSQGSPTQQPQQSGGDAGAFDFKRAFESQGKELQSTKQGLGRMSGELESLKKEAETVRRIREAFAPEEGGKKENPTASKIADLEKQLDHYLAEAVEADKRGAPIPLTTNLAVHLFQSQIAHLQEREALMAKIEAMEAKLNQAADPQQAINMQAYSALDTFVKQGLDQLYGRDDKRADQKNFQFDAITRQMSQSLKAIMETKPRVWEQMRRDPDALRKMANHFLKQNIPPQAVHLIEQENLQKTEMTTRELGQAFQEAGEIADPQERARIRQDIRRKIFENEYVRDMQAKRDRGR